MKLNFKKPEINLKDLTVKKVLIGGVTFIFYTHIFMFVIVGLMSIFMIWFNPPFSSLMLYRAGFNPMKIDKPRTIRMEKIPKIFIHDLLNAEDGRFYEHWGFDVEAIKTARKLNKKLGRRAYGGSSITQQLARTLFLIPKKMYVRKYLELLIAVEMDLILSKDRILELYLSYAEWGEMVYGVEDASMYYYKKPFSKISSEQRIRLITILASPIKYSPNTYHKNRLLRKRYQNIMRWH